MKSKLDISALYHCASMNKNFINSFRVSVTFKEIVDPNLLQVVVDSLVLKYPTICSRITHDFFNYYTESLNKLTIRKNKKLFTTLDFNSIYNEAIAIFYNHKTISVELFHGVSDGGGFFMFFQDLITQYVYLKHEIPHQIENIEYDLSDSFENTPTNQYKKNKSIKITNPYQFEKKHKNIKDKATTFILDSKEIKELSKQYSCTINEYLLSIIYRSILNHSNQKNVYLSIPINLRRKFESSTLKNFTLIADIGINKKDGDSIEHLIQEIRKQMNIQNETQYLGYRISSIKKLNIFTKYIPIFIKNMFIRIGTAFVGNKGCMTVSNLGLMKFKDQQIHSYIDSMDVILSSREKTPYNCGIVTINDKMHINITHNEINQHLIEQIKEELLNMNIKFNVQEYQ